MLKSVADALSGKLRVLAIVAAASVAGGTGAAFALTAGSTPLNVVTQSDHAQVAASHSPDAESSADTKESDSDTNKAGQNSSQQGQQLRPVTHGWCVSTFAQNQHTSGFSSLSKVTVAEVAQSDAGKNSTKTVPTGNAPLVAGTWTSLCGASFATTAHGQSGSTHGQSSNHSQTGQHAPNSHATSEATSHSHP